MPSKSKFTRDDNGNIAVRVISNDSSVTNSDSMFTTDDNGNTAVRVVMEGQHNLGWYSTPEALAEAHPTAEAGDWAIVGSTDTVWIWDVDTSAWVDSDTKGQVTSVNNQTGEVVLTSTDILPSQTGHSGHVLGTDGFVAGWVEPEIVQRSTMPQASEDELGNVYQFVGTTSASYTNGYFYKCVSDGQQPATYSWTQVDVQPAVDPLPSQSGNAGKFLTTDGTDASWSDKPLVNSADSTTKPESIIITPASGSNTITPSSGDPNIIIGDKITLGTSGSYKNSIAIGYRINELNNQYANGIFICPNYMGKASDTNMVFSVRATDGITCGKTGGIIIATQQITEIGPNNGGNSILIAAGESSARINADYTTFINSGARQNTITEANTFWWGNYNGVYKLVDSDGTIPTDRFTTTPVADGTYVPTLTISSGVATRTWGAAPSAPVVPSTMPTLAVADWSSNTQTVSVTGVTASNIVIVSPAPASAADYAAAGIVCTAQGAGTLTFTCTTDPTSNISVNVVILN